MIVPGRHNLKQVMLSLGGIPISGYGEEGGVEFEYGAPLIDPLVGADGHVAISVNNNESMTCRITLLQTTRAYGLLALAFSAQRTLMKASPIVPPLPFLMVAPNGDKVDDPFATFLDVPAPNQARRAGERVFALFLPTARSRLVLGAGTIV